MKKAASGFYKSTDYKKIFFEAYPELEGKIIVHHALEQQVLIRYPGIISEEEIHSLENLRGIPKESNSDLHLGIIRKEWNRFYKTNPKPTKEKLFEKALEIDRKYGQLFNPSKG